MKSCRNTLIILILFNCLLFGQERTDLWSISIALMDSTGKLSIDEVLALPESDFSTPGGGAKRINKRSPTYLRFNLPELTTGRRYLHLEPHTVDSIILFQNSRPIRLSGGNVKMNDRSTKTSRYGYVLPNEAGHYLLK